MEDTMKHSAVITPQGALRIYNRPLFEEEVRAMSRETDLAVTVEVKLKKRVRSDVQNAYYWGVVVAMISQRLRELGHDVDRDLTHEFLKGRFLYTEFTDPTSGEVMKIPRKTSELATEEFMEYVEHVKQFAAETLDIYIPDPNEQLEI
ncbi:MAG: hypothetical protein ACK5DE_07760 [Bacteroidota bacterium]|jgi:hypothetical protein